MTLEKLAIGPPINEGGSKHHARAYHTEDDAHEFRPAVIDDDNVGTWIFEYRNDEDNSAIDAPGDGRLADAVEYTTLDKAVEKLTVTTPLTATEARVTLLNDGFHASPAEIEYRTDVPADDVESIVNATTAKLSNIEDAEPLGSKELQSSVTVNPTEIR